MEKIGYILRESPITVYLETDNPELPGEEFTGTPQEVGQEMLELLSTFSHTIFTLKAVKPKKFLKLTDYDLQQLQQQLNSGNRAIVFLAVNLGMTTYQQLGVNTSVK